MASSTRTPRFSQSGLFFVPHRWQSAAFLRWLKRVHAWTGFYGALLFLLMGTSGFLLNHRAQLKIETGAPQEASRVEIPVVPGAIADADALGQWAKKQLDLPGKPQPPRPEGGEAGPKRFGAATVSTMPVWSRSFSLVDARVTVEYVPGANHATARREPAGLLGTLKNLHKGTGLGIVWVLFLDTIAGALIAMSLTGFLLWSRLHGTRLAAGALVATSAGLALFAVLPNL